MTATQKLLILVTHLLHLLYLHAGHHEHALLGAPQLALQLVELTSQVLALLVVQQVCTTQHNSTQKRMIDVKNLVKGTSHNDSWAHCERV